MAAAVRHRDVDQDRRPALADKTITDMPDNTTATQDTELAMPRQRDGIAALVRTHLLRSSIASFMHFWFDWLETLDRLPSRADFDPALLKPWLSTIRIIRVEQGLPQHAGKLGLNYRYFYRLIGTEHRKYDDRDFTHTYLDETNLSLDRVAYLGTSYERIIASRWPLLMNHDHFGAGRGMFACQRVICPFAGPDGEIAELFGVWSYGRLIGTESKMDETTRLDWLRSERKPQPPSDNEDER
jgi:hypothetical protein